MGARLSRDRALAVVETQRKIAISQLNEGAVMALVVEQAAGLTDAAASVIELAEGDEMVYRVGVGLAVEQAGVRLKIDQSLSGLCVRQGVTLHCHNAATDGRVDPEACRRVGAISIVCVPLNRDSRVIGVLKVYDPRPNAFDGDDVIVLDLLSGVIAAHMAHVGECREHLAAKRQATVRALRGTPSPQLTTRSG
jgi:GAF domain-containing protein